MLNIYMGYDAKAGSREAAVLVFAHDSKEARKLGWAEMKSLYNTLWTDMATRLMRKNQDYLYSDADQDKLTADEAHVVIDMRVCPDCEMWGEYWDGEHCGICEERECVQKN